MHEERTEHEGRTLGDGVNIDVVHLATCIALGTSAALRSAETTSCLLTLPLNTAARCWCSWIAPLRTIVGIMPHFPTFKACVASWSSQSDWPHWTAPNESQPELLESRTWGLGSRALKLKHRAWRLLPESFTLTSWAYPAGMESNVDDCYCLKHPE